MPAQAVQIRPNGTVIETKVKVRQDQHEDVRWIALMGGGPWRITFDAGDGSPFSMTEYWVGPGASEGTTGGPVAGIVGKTYKYNVRNAVSNVITQDPDVDVE